MCFKFSGDSSSAKGDNKKDSRPFFKTFATLTIPNVVMQPALDEVQQAVNKAAQKVIFVSKGIAKWSDERKRHIKPSQVGYFIFKKTLVFHHFAFKINTQFHEN